MGYKHEQFSKKLDQNIQCSICHEVFKELMSCTAGHTFCRECIHRWLQSNERCPADNTYLDKKSLVPNLTVKGIIDDLDVYCHPVSIGNTELSPANKRIRLENSTDDEGDEENCCWTGKLQDLPTHRKTCAFELVSCTYENCKQQIKRKGFEKHKEACKYKRVACKECTSFVVECKLPEHLENDCPNAMIPCKNNCSTDGAVTKIKSHAVPPFESTVNPHGMNERFTFN
ncbi:TNF receptor-associated factor 5-like [Actinia tenebrosa]|uniref:TNF receptor-associated factor 5-like n=1 Tax=Actinia tenebrosa TaxID=6105 RepID=A0A6P8J062_ACTTE|nr:TNF receptor-associated factor 5-like [Actinia tenebrosa]